MSGKETKKWFDGAIKLADLLSNADPSGASSAAVQSLDWLSSFVNNRREKRVIEFHRAMLNRDTDAEAIKSAEIEQADFHALLTACVMDIEDEKTTAFALMARNIALGLVDKDVRRHFILALRDLSFDQLDFIRRLYVITQNRIGQPGTNTILSVKDNVSNVRPGTPLHLIVTALSSRGFIDDEKLTDMGKDFVKSCTDSEFLTPAVYNYRKSSPYKCQLISLIADGATNEAFINAISDKLSRELIVIPPVICLGGVNQRLNQVPLSANCGIVLRMSANDVPTEADRYLRSLTGKIPFIQAVIGRSGLGEPYGTKTVPFDNSTPTEDELDALIRVMRVEFGKMVYGKP